VTSATFDASGAPSCWRLTYEGDGAIRSTDTDALVLTGTGPATTLSGGLGPEDGLVDAVTFWHKDVAARIAGLVEGQIVVLGSGGAAGTILAHLATLRLAEHNRQRSAERRQASADIPNGTVQKTGAALGQIATIRQDYTPRVQAAATPEERQGLVE
jgi:hypothetical protein